MNPNQLRTALADTLERSPLAAFTADAHDIADVLLPTVTAYAAAALRDAADWYGICGDYGVMRQLRDRADLLEAQR